MTAEAPRGVVDFEYLEQFCSGDMQVVVEVLTTFLDQAEIWFGALDGAREDLRETAHTIKGASRGVGARALGEAAAQVEAMGPENLPLLKTELREAVAEVEGYLTRVNGG